MSKKSSLVSFTARQRGGAIVIRVVSCSNLPDMDAAGRSDPYVKVTCNGNTQKTKVSDNFRNPVFDPSTSTFTFSVAGAPAGAHIFFDVMDKDTFSKDDLMGKANVVLSPALLTAADSGVILSLPLSGQGISDDPDLMPQPGMAGMGQPGMGQPGYPQPGYPAQPQGFPGQPQPYPGQPQGYPPQQAYPPQGYPPQQGYPGQPQGGFNAPGYPPY